MNNTGKILLTAAACVFAFSSTQEKMPHRELRLSNELLFETALRNTDSLSQMIDNVYQSKRELEIVPICEKVLTPALDIKVRIDTFYYVKTIEKSNK
jgi:hypothetical protein